MLALYVSLPTRNSATGRHEGLLRSLTSGRAPEELEIRTLVTVPAVVADMYAGVLIANRARTVTRNDREKVSPRKALNTTTGFIGSIVPGISSLSSLIDGPQTGGWTPR